MTYVGGLQVVSIYLVLGIAADDIFVFVDAWRQSASLPESVFKGDKKKRMAYAFRRACRAMAVTSSTTSVAFFANVFSPVMPIKSFGILSGVIIPLNYLFVVVFMPPAVIHYESKLQNKCCCCINMSKKNEKTKDYEEETVAKSELEKPSKVELFFEHKWPKFIEKAKFAILAVALVWTIFAGIMASKIGPQTEDEQFISPDNPILKVFTIQQDQFKQYGDFRTKIYFVWGIEDVDRSEETAWDVEYLGTPIYDPNFQPWQPESQQYLSDFCDEVEKQTFVEDDDIDCWIRNFKTFLGAKPFPVPTKAEFAAEFAAWMQTGAGIRAAALN